MSCIKTTPCPLGWAIHFHQSFGLPWIPDTCQKLIEMDKKSLNDYNLLFKQQLDISKIEKEVKTAGKILKI